MAGASSIKVVLLRVLLVGRATSVTIGAEAISSETNPREADSTELEERGS